MMNIISKQLGGFAILVLAHIAVLISTNAVAAGVFTGTSKDIIAYLYVRVNTMTAVDGSPSLQSTVEKYPVLYADFGGRCEYFLKKTRQDITRGSRLSERVYFKDVTAIRAFKGVPVSSDRFGLNISVGNKTYQVRKWSGMAALSKDIRGGDCSNIRNEDVSYTWPVLHFKVISRYRTVQWIEADLTNIVEFAYDRRRGRKLYEAIAKDDKKESTLKQERSKSFQQLKAEAQERAERRAQEQKQPGADMSVELLSDELINEFRASLAEGDDSHCGLIIEVRNKVVKVQTASGEYWLKRKQLYPADSRPCNFVGGIYQEP